MHKRPVIAVLFALSLALLVLKSCSQGHWGHFIEDKHLRCLTYFLSGMLFYLYRDRIPFSFRLLVLSTLGIVLAAALGGLAALLPVLGTYVLMYAAFNAHSKLQDFGRHRDLSYGVYLYGWPVSQLFVLILGVGTHPFLLFLLASAGSCGMAALSWHFIEHPALRRKPQEIRLSAPPGTAPNQIPDV